MEHGIVGKVARRIALAVGAYFAACAATGALFVWSVTTKLAEDE